MKTLLTTTLGLLMVLALSAQVGVNNINPKQTLDVNGKIKVADDSTSPSPGTMRYNEKASSFEGYDGTKWVSFTERQTGALPSNPIPIYGVNQGSGIIKNFPRSLTLGDWETGTTFQTPPSGKFLVITGVYPRTLTVTDPEFKFTIGASSSLNGTLKADSWLLILSETNVNRPITGDSAPLFVVRPGEYLTVDVISALDIGPIYVHVRGFLVDSLNY